MINFILFIIAIDVGCTLINAIFCRFVPTFKNCDCDEKTTLIVCGIFSCPIMIVIAAQAGMTILFEKFLFSRKLKNSSFLVEQFNKLIG